MKKKRIYNVGDKIVDYGQIFSIFEIKEHVIYFKPYFENVQTQAFVCSIPIKNIRKTQIRRPVTKEKLKECVQILKDKILEEEFKDINQAKELLGTNKLSDIAKFMVYMYKEMHASETVSHSKKEIFEKASERFAHELAIITNASVKKAKNKIHHALNA